MKYKKGDLLTTANSQGRPVARVTKVARDGTVHCENLVECQSMKVGHEFHFVPDVRTKLFPIEENGEQ